MNPLWQSVASLITKRRLTIVKGYLHGDILDIGCGRVEIARFLNAGVHYVGVDCDATLVEDLRHRFNNASFEFIITDLENERLPFERDFNTIAMLAFLEHIKNTKNVLSECLRVLADEGVLVITTPTPLGDRILRTLVAMLDPFSKNVVIRPHEHIYKQSELIELLENSGFTVEYYRKFELGGNQICVARKKK